MSEPRKRATFEEIRDLVLLVAERGLSALEVEQGGCRIRIVGSRPAPGIAAAGANAQELHVVTSPVVGTFYRAPSPEASPFVGEGQTIAKGKILCIVESGRLMNEIESEVAGEIVEVYARSGQAVEYGERLFSIRLAGERKV